MELQLNKILTSLQIITTRIDALDLKMDGFNERLNAVEVKFSNCYDELEKNFTKSKNEMDDMKVTIDDLIRFKDQQERTALQNESYSKRQNILIHGIDEDEKSVRKNRDIAIQKLKTFKKNRLEVDFDKVPFVDFHRLLQQPVFKLGKRITRPITVKLAYMEDKTAISKAAKNLKKYNRTRREMKQSSPYVYIIYHLPRAFQEQRKKLLPSFNKARADKQKTKWQIENGEYSLYIDNEKVNLN